MQKNQNETVLQEANTTRALINRIRKRQANFFFWPRDEKRETRTSCDIWDDQGKTQHRKTA